MRCGYWDALAIATMAGRRSNSSTGGGRPRLGLLGLGLCQLQTATLAQCCCELPQAIEAELPAVIGCRERDSLRIAARERRIHDPECGLMRDRYGAVRTGR